MNFMRTVYVKICSNEKRIAYYRKLGMRIGNGCHISGNVKFGSEPYLIRIGNNVRLTENVQFVNHDGGMWVLRNLDPEMKKYDIVKPIVIGDNVHIGIGSTIMPGVRIGSNVIVGCSSVVTHDIPDNSVAAGVPARILRSLDEYREKNARDFIPTRDIPSGGKREYLLDRYREDLK